MTNSMAVPEHRINWRDRPRSVLNIGPWLHACWLRFWLGPVQTVTVVPEPPALHCSACPAEVTPAVVDFAGRCVSCSNEWADMEFARMVQVEQLRVSAADVLAQLRAEDEPPAPPAPVVVVVAPANREYVLRRAASARTPKALRRQVTQLILSGTDAGLIQDALCVYVEPQLLASAGSAVSAS